MHFRLADPREIGGERYCPVTRGVFCAVLAKDGGRKTVS